MSFSMRASPFPRSRSCFEAFQSSFLGAEMGGVLLEATGESGKLPSHNNPAAAVLDSPT